MAQTGEQQQRILRVGIVHEGHILEERLLHKPADVTVGLSPQCTFILPIPKPPEMYRLFVREEGRYWLRFTGAMVGKVQVGGQILDLSEVRAGPLAKKVGEYWLLPLGPADAGKVVFGEVRLLFQMVAPPPKPKKIALPPAAKGGPLAALNGQYAWAVVASLIVHVGIVGGAAWWWRASGQFEESQRRESIVYRVLKAEMTLREKAEKVEAVPGEGEGEGDKGEGDKDAGKEQKPSKAYTKTAGGGETDEDKYRRQVAKVRNNTLVGMLDNVGGGVRGLVGAEAADSGMEGAFSTSGGGGTLIASEGYGYKGGKGGGAGGGGAGGNTYQRLSADDVKGGGALKTGPVASGERKGEEQVKIRISGALGAQSGPGKIDASTVESVFRRRKSAIQMCYERALKVNQSVEGKISIKFTIGAAGTVTDIAVIENSTGDSGIGACISEKVRSWPFPQPDGGLVIVTRHFLLVKS